MTQTALTGTADAGIPATPGSSEYTAASERRASRATRGMAIDAALSFVHAQQILLKTAFQHVERLSELSEISRDASDEIRNACEREFQELASSLRRLTLERCENEFLFSGATLVVEVPPVGNKLIMAGINLHQPPFVALHADRLLRPGSAHGRPAFLDEAFRCVAMAQAVVGENLVSLSFHANGIEVLKERRNAGWRSLDSDSPSRGDCASDTSQTTSAEPTAIHRAA